jgi:drug/metabolite transporter (DMT)-like permease
MGLDVSTTLLVLLAAAMHATWNALVKVEQDRLTAVALINGAGAVMGAVLVALAPPMRAEAWAYLTPSLILQSGYMGVLMLTYRLGDLSQVYPVARGIAPLGVVVFSMLVDGLIPPRLQVLGVAAISLGIVSLAWRRAPSASTPGNAPAGHSVRSRLPVLIAASNGLVISAYTVLDAKGVRLSGSPLAYGGWIFVLYGLPWVVIALVRRGVRPFQPEARHWMLMLFAGTLCFGAYLAVVYGLSRGAASAVSALRESSVIFAALIGTLMLKEPFGPRRIAAAALVALGVILIRLG